MVPNVRDCFLVLGSCFLVLGSYDLIKWLAGFRLLTETLSLPFMNLFTDKAIIIVTCPKRLAPWLQQEINELGFITDEVFVTGVRLSGTINDCIKLNLNLRCASQVLYKLQQFEAKDADAIYKNLVDYPWENLLPSPGYSM